MIAVAAGIKLYPAIFGLLYVKEKRWSETLRLIAYGVLFFVVSFAFLADLEASSNFC
ncbi:MAG: DUF2029 domain-containing protein [Clostridia bacterium]|nr:DUF2029 domain-containing protein [Clostridia bacterium]